MDKQYELFVDAESLSEDSLTAPVVDFSAIIIDTEKMVSNNPYTMRDIVKVKRFKIDTEEQMSVFGAVPSEHTISFWKSQPKEIRMRIKPHQDDLSVEHFVKSFSEFIGSEPKLGRIWARNTSFDIILLRRLFKMANKNIDDYIDHYMVRDIRSALDASFAFEANTNLNFCPVKDEEFWNKVFEPHNSTWDVIADVLRYQVILRNDAGLEQIKR